jgi:hypothetical protein
MSATVTKQRDKGRKQIQGDTRTIARGGETLMAAAILN